MAAKDDFDLHVSQMSKGTGKAQSDYSTTDLFRVFHQSDSSLWVVDSLELDAWSVDTKVQDTSVDLSAGPSPVWFQGNLYVFHQGVDGLLWYNKLVDSFWVGDQQVPNTGISGTPSAVRFHDKLWVLHQRDNQLWYNIFDGHNWAGDILVPNTGITSGPGAVVFGGQLYVFHQSGKDTLELRFQVYDGTKWLTDQKVPGIGTSSGPSAVVFNDKIYCFHKAADDNALWYNVFNGEDWEGDIPVPRTQLLHAPAAIVSEGPKGSTIVVFHHGAGDDLWFNAFDVSTNSWKGDIQVPKVVTSSGPGVVFGQPPPSKH